MRAIPTSGAGVGDRACYIADPYLECSVILRTTLVLFSVLALAACGSDPLPPAPSGGGNGDGGGGSGGDGGGGTGGDGGGGTGGEGGGQGGSGGTGGEGGGAPDPLAACSAEPDQCNNGQCLFADTDCQAAVDGWLAQCESGLCGMRDRDGNCPPRADIEALCARERLDGASGNMLWHCFTLHDACDDAFTGCMMDLCTPD